jgi:hypothetical protein
VLKSVSLFSKGLAGFSEIFTLKFGRLLHAGTYYSLQNIVTCRWVPMMRISGSKSDDWIYRHFGYNLS